MTTKKVVTLEDYLENAGVKTLNSKDVERSQLDLYTWNNLPRRWNFIISCLALLVTMVGMVAQILFVWFYLMDWPAATTGWAFASILTCWCGFGFFLIMRHLSEKSFFVRKEWRHYPPQDPILRARGLVVPTPEQEKMRLIATLVPSPIFVVENLHPTGHCFLALVVIPNQKERGRKIYLAQWL